MGMSGLHAVIVPFPAKGTINPVINLAQLLSSRGVFITFVNTEWSHMCMSKAAHNDEEPAFKFLTIPDGLPPDDGRLANLGEYIIAMENLGPVLEHHLLSSLADGKTPPITCIITENFMSCTQQVAKKLGVRRVIFWTLCAASSIAQCNANLLLSRGHIPVKVEESKRADKVITCLPGNLPPLLPSDLFSFYRATDISGVLFQWALRESQFQSKADYVLVNTRACISSQFAGRKRFERAWEFAGVGRELSEMARRPRAGFCDIRFLRQHRCQIKRTARGAGAWILREACLQLCRRVLKRGQKIGD
ncbi:hypothetical protein SUGI_0089740 [Cryptomeria japonica]|nr:hypothetical protein SUGI_0089740 [Cryptomeria japonica]